MFPERYQNSEEQITLSMMCSHKDKTPGFWKTESEHLETEFLYQGQKGIIERSSNDNV